MIEDTIWLINLRRSFIIRFKVTKAHSPVKVGVGWPLDIQVPLADVIDGFIVNLNTAHKPNENVTDLSTNDIRVWHGDKSKFTMKAQSECSRVVWAHKVELYGSTTAVAT